ncbi:hypothetical protein GCM10023336_01550 [Streptomyces similanensis]|uniref:Uncharacterized protein n=1 Tax=Streptomyces similanensis TaxID=1274988 RepID=A0ABP9JQV5_9ACTN
MARTAWPWLAVGVLVLAAALDPLASGMGLKVERAELVHTEHDFGFARLGEYPLVRELAAADARHWVPVAVTYRVLGLARQPYYRWPASPTVHRRVAPRGRLLHPPSAARLGDRPVPARCCPARHGLPGDDGEVGQWLRR